MAQNLSLQPSHAAILISDLVQSEPTKDSVDLATELSRLADLHSKMTLLSYLRAEQMLEANKTA